MCENVGIIEFGRKRCENVCIKVFYLKLCENTDCSFWPEASEIVKIFFFDLNYVKMQRL